VDGASEWQRYRFIIIPGIFPIIRLLFILRIIQNFIGFDMIYSLTGGGPGTITEVLSIYIYRLNFFNKMVGPGASSSFFLLMIIIVISYFLFRVLPSEEKELEPRPEADNLVGIYAALAGVPKARVLGEFGGAQFSTFKSALVDLAVETLGPLGAEMKRLVQDPVYIDSVLADGSARAQALAAETMKAVKDIVGFVRR
jgi:hypothetical protein